MKLREMLLIGLLAGCVGCNSTTDTKAQDEAAIKALAASFDTAFKAKDVDAIMTHYVPDQTLVAFDVVPPRQYAGAAAYRKDWEDTFAMFPGPVDDTVTELDVTVGGDVAFSHCIQHVSFTDKDGKKSELTVRITDGYKKINGQWLIVHEHVSIPVDLTTLKPDLDSK